MDNVRNAETAQTAPRQTVNGPASTNAASKTASHAGPAALAAAAPGGSPPVSVDIRASDIQSVRVIDTDLVITTREGKRVVIRDGALRAMLEPQFVVSFADGEMSGATLFHQAGDSTPQTLRLITAGPNQGEPAQPSPAEEARSSQDTRAGEEARPGEGGKAIAQVSPAHDTAVSATPLPATPPPDEQPSGIAIGDTGVLPPPPKGEDVATTPKAPDQAPWKIFDLAQNINALSVLSTLGGLGALAGAGGGGASGAGSSASDSVLASVTVVAGTFINAVQVDIYDANGLRVGGGLSDSTGGHFNGTLSLAAGYSGTLLVKVSDVSGGAADYLNEATGQATSLGTPLRSVITYNGGAGGLMSATVTPLTELAARIITGSTDSTNAVTPLLSASDAASVNQAVASAFGLSSITGDSVAVLGSAGFAGSPASARAYGAVLAALAGYDTQSGGIARTLDALSVDTASGRLVTGTGVLAAGADLVQGTDAASGDSAANVVHALLAPIVSLQTAQALNFSSDRIAALSAAETSGIAPAQWALMNAAQIGALGANSAGLNVADILAFHPAQIAALSNSAMANLAPAVIAAMPVADIAAISTTQLNAMSHAQDLAWTTAQKAAMSSAQLAVLH